MKIQLSAKGVFFPGTTCQVLYLGAQEPQQIADAITQVVARLPESLEADKARCEWVESEPGAIAHAPFHAHPLALTLTASLAADVGHKKNLLRLAAARAQCAHCNERTGPLVAAGVKGSEK